MYDLHDSGFSLAGNVQNQGLGDEGNNNKKEKLSSLMEMLAFNLCLNCIKRS